MKERPIPYSPDMVRARRAGLKTQTRRAMNPQPTGKFLGLIERPVKHQNGPLALRAWFAAGEGEQSSQEIKFPYGRVGDALWVREAYRVPAVYDGLPPRRVPIYCPVWYEADGRAPAEFGRYRHAKFMCRWMSRGLDEIVSVRAQQLQDVNSVDAMAEGLVDLGVDAKAQIRHAPLLPWARWHWNPSAKAGYFAPWRAYRALWESINGTWNRKQWVWAIEFKVLA